MRDERASLRRDRRRRLLRRLELRAMQQADGGLKLRVLVPVRRDVGVRAFFLLGPVLEMAEQRGFTQARDLALEVVRDVLEDGDVGLDAPSLNRTARRRVVERG